MLSSFQRTAVATAAVMLSASPLAAQGGDHGQHGAKPAAAPTAVAAANWFRAPAGARVMQITARDYAFEAPDTVPAGLTAIRLTNLGPDLHHVYLMKVGEGKTQADLIEALKASKGGALPSWITPVGGPNTPRPGGGESNATILLEAGQYQMMCVIPAPDGMPHVMKGMMKSLTVVPAAVPAAAAKAPTADVVLTLRDYGFDFSSPITAGVRTLSVENAAAQPHEVFIARLAPGKTVAELLQWIGKPNGPPPAEPLGGTTDILKGGRNLIQLDFTPGEYAFICFSPDKEGKPHFMHGMQQQLSVK